MTLITLGVVAAVGGFGYLVYKHGLQAAVAAVVAFSGAVALAVSDLAQYF